MTLDRFLCLDDFEPAARAHLPRPLFEYVCGGVQDNRSRADNRTAFDDWQLVPRVMVDISGRSSEQTLFDQTWSAPFGIAPMGICALTAYRGDAVLAQAAQAARIPMIMSGSSLMRLEDIVALNPQAWFQAYLPGRQPEIEALIDRVARAGFGTLVITVDTPASANRENNLRAGFSTPLRPSLALAWQGLSHPRWLLGTFTRTLLQHGMPHFENNAATRGAPIVSRTVARDMASRGHFTWANLRRIREQWRGRLVVKGILHADDARQACDVGADGIIVSNHGGRQLDGAVSPLRVLPGIGAGCPDTVVMMDSGVRRGTDALKALALGARLVFVGRPFNYAAAVGGLAGAARAAYLLQQEILRDMAMLGINRLDELGPALLWPQPGQRQQA
jgi:L-lactate dehydrogenase (cytochrome)